MEKLFLKYNIIIYLKYEFFFFFLNFNFTFVTVKWNDVFIYFFSLTFYIINNNKSK